MSQSLEQKGSAEEAEAEQRNVQIAINEEEAEQKEARRAAILTEKSNDLHMFCEILQISREREIFLRESPIEDFSVWFRAVYEGLPVQELKKMRQNQWSKGEIFARILLYRKKQLLESDTLAGQMEELKRQTQEALADYRYLRDTYVQELSESRKQERNTQQKALEAKEEIIRVQREKIADLEGKMRMLKRERKPIGQKETETSEERRNLFQRIEQARRKRSELERFREQYLMDTNYSQEQKEYLLCCFEEGLKFSEIQRFASPFLTVDQMERLKKSYEKRYRKT